MGEWRRLCGRLGLRSTRCPAAATRITRRTPPTWAIAKSRDCRQSYPCSAPTGALRPCDGWGFAACGGIIGPTAAGWVYDRMEDYYFVWLAFSALIGVAIILILMIEPKSQNEARNAIAGHEKL